MSRFLGKSKRMWLMGVGALVVGLILLRPVLWGKKTPPIITAPAIRMDLEESVLASGTLNAFKTVAVGAQVSGQLRKLHVVVGDRVKKGELLAEIDPSTQRNELLTAEASLNSSVASLKAKQALYRQYDLTYQRQKILVRQDASAHADLEAAQATLESTKAEILTLEAAIKKAQIAVDTAKVNLGYTRISAPLDGTILSITTEEGQTVVSTQSATTILTLANLDTLTVKAQISEADVAKVRPGQTVYFTTLGDADTRHYSRLRAIEPGPTSSTSSSSSSSTTSSSSSSAIYYNGLFEIPNPDKLLRASMTAQVSILLQEAKGVLCIPVAALGDKDRTGWCQTRVLRGELLEPRRVRIGINNRVYAQVLEGLREGERVVIGDTAAPVDERRGMRPPPRR